MNLHCYYNAAGTFILSFKEALLEVADIIRRRDEFIHNSRVEYTDLFCVVSISRKLKHCIINLQTALKFL